MASMVIGFLAQIGGAALLVGREVGGTHGFGLSLLIAGSAWLVAGAVQATGDYLLREVRRLLPSDPTDD